MWQPGLTVTGKKKKKKKELQNYHQTVYTLVSLLGNSGYFEPTSPILFAPDQDVSYDI